MLFEFCNFDCLKKKTVEKITVKNDFLKKRGVYLRVFFIYYFHVYKSPKFTSKFKLIHNLNKTNTSTTTTTTQTYKTNPAPNRPHNNQQKTPSIQYVILPVVFFCLFLLNIKKYAILFYASNFYSQKNNNKQQQQHEKH